MVFKEVVTDLVTDDEAQLVIGEGFEQARRDHEQQPPLFGFHGGGVEGTRRVDEQFQGSVDPKGIAATVDDAEEIRCHLRRQPRRRREQMASGGECVGVLLDLVDGALHVGLGEEFRAQFLVSLGDEIGARLRDRRVARAAVAPRLVHAGHRLSVRFMRFLPSFVFVALRSCGYPVVIALLQTSHRHRRGCFVCLGNRHLGRRDAIVALPGFTKRAVSRPLPPGTLGRPP